MLTTMRIEISAACLFPPLLTGWPDMGVLGACPHLYRVTREKTPACWDQFAAGSVCDVLSTPLLNAAAAEHPNQLKNACNMYH